jgi:hypothetical protein
MTATTDPARPPVRRIKVSVVVPVRNEAATLPQVLDSLFRQSRPPDEIVIADGGSTDHTADAASAYAGRGVRVVALGPAYPGRARNEGVLAARNDWLAFIDAGCEAHPEWLEGLLAAVGEGSDLPCAIYGSYEVRRDTEWERAQALAYVAPVDPATGCRPLSIASSLIHRAAWAAAGRFREDLRAAEDLLFFARLEAAGVPILRSARALVTWRLPEGPAAVFKRFRLYSAHHMSAGLSRSWHRRVMAMDVAAVLMAAGAPLGWGLLLLLGIASLARLLRTVLVRRRNIAPLSAFRPDRLARVGIILVLADAAVWAGAVDHLRARAASVRTPA